MPTRWECPHNQTRFIDGILRDKRPLKIILPTRINSIEAIIIIAADQTNKSIVRSRLNSSPSADLRASLPVFPISYWVGLKGCELTVFRFEMADGALTTVMEIKQTGQGNASDKDIGRAILGQIRPRRFGAGVAGPHSIADTQCPRTGARW
jgi:hypothetical protein